MEQLLNGRFEYEVPKLTLSDTQINLTTNEGENVRGELYVAAEDNRRIKGMTMSSNRQGYCMAKSKNFCGNNRMYSLRAGCEGTVRR